MTKPLHGALSVALLIGLSRQRARLQVELEFTQANGQPAVRLLDASGALLGVMGLQVADGAIVSVFNQINPDKLAHLGPVGDLSTLTMTPGPASSGPT